MGKCCLTVWRSSNTSKKLTQIAKTSSLKDPTKKACTKDTKSDGCARYCMILLQECLMAKKVRSRQTMLSKKNFPCLRKLLPTQKGHTAMVRLFRWLMCSLCRSLKMRSSSILMLRDYALRFIRSSYLWIKFRNLQIYFNSINLQMMIPKILI